MITRHSHTTVFVLDQTSAKSFYVDKLGFECRDDVNMGPFRWLTVAPKTQPDAVIVLMALAPSPMTTADDVEQIRALVKKGALSGGVLECDDCAKTYAELAAKGVEFIREPKEMPYGIEALFKDDSGNFYSMCQRRG